MKTSKGIIGVLTLTLTLLFTGCAKDTPPNEDTEKTGQSLETEAQGQAQGEGTDGITAEGSTENHNAPEMLELTEDSETAAPAAIFIHRKTAAEHGTQMMNRLARSDNGQWKRMSWGY